MAIKYIRGGVLKESPTTNVYYAYTPILLSHRIKLASNANGTKFQSGVNPREQSILWRNSLFKQWSHMANPETQKAKEGVSMTTLDAFRRDVLMRAWSREQEPQDQIDFDKLPKTGSKQKAPSDASTPLKYKPGKQKKFAQSPSDHKSVSKQNTPSEKEALHFPESAILIDTSHIRIDELGLGSIKAATDILTRFYNGELDPSANLRAPDGTRYPAIDFIEAAFLQAGYRINTASAKRAWKDIGKGHVVSVTESIFWKFSPPIRYRGISKNAVDDLFGANVTAVDGTPKGLAPGDSSGVRGKIEEASNDRPQARALDKKASDDRPRQRVPDEKASDDRPRQRVPDEKASSIGHSHSEERGRAKRQKNGPEVYAIGDYAFADPSVYKELSNDQSLNAGTRYWMDYLGRFVQLESRLQEESASRVAKRQRTV